MKSIIEIIVANKLGKLLNTRESAVELFNLISSGSHKIVVLDFSQVEFISRSFADQFYKERRKIQDKITIKISNLSEEIINVLNKVEKTQNKTNREYINLPIFHFSKSNKLSEYLFSI